MKSYNDRLGTNALMTPHMLVTACRFCNTVPNECKKVEGEIFCIPPMFDNKLGGETAISMGIDEQCIHDIYKDKDNDETWWNYMENLNSCKDNHFDSGCIKRVRELSRINLVELTKCQSSAISILHREYSMLMITRIPYNPAVVVNNKIYRVILFLYIGNFGW